MEKLFRKEPQKFFPSLPPCHLADASHPLAHVLRLMKIASNKKKENPAASKLAPGLFYSLKFSRCLRADYSRISLTTPEPTVRPPSRYLHDVIDGIFDDFSPLL